MANKNGMKNKNEIIESSGEFEVIFGDNLDDSHTVGIELCSKSLNSIKLLLKEGIEFECAISGKDVEYIDNSLRLEIKGAKQISSGILVSLIAHMKINAPTAHKGSGFRNVFTAVVAWLKMKEHLKGKHANNIYLRGNQSVVENEFGEEKLFPADFMKYFECFVDNPKVDKAIATLFSKNSREYMTFQFRLEVKILKREFKKMATDIFGRFNERPSQEELHIIKPNLAGIYNWSLTKNGDKIRATMKDDDFMREVLQEGKVFCNGLNILCDMITEDHVTTAGKIVCIYTIKRVIGEPYP